MPAGMTLPLQEADLWLRARGVTIEWPEAIWQQQSIVDIELDEDGNPDSVRARPLTSATGPAG